MLYESSANKSLVTESAKNIRSVYGNETLILILMPASILDGVLFFLSQTLASIRLQR